MYEFLREEVTYISENDVSSAFKLFKNDPDATKEVVLEMFKKLKFLF